MLGFVFFKMPSHRSRREKNRAKKIAKLNDDSCADESQDIECEERDSFQRKKKRRRLVIGIATKPILRVRKAYYDQKSRTDFSSRQIQRPREISQG